MTKKRRDFGGRRRRGGGRRRRRGGNKYVGTSNKVKKFHVLLETVKCLQKLKCIGFFELLTISSLLFFAQEEEDDSVRKQIEHLRELGSRSKDFF